MEHITEVLYMSAAAAVFIMAVSLMLLVGRATDHMLDAGQQITLPGQILTEENLHE